MKITRILPKPLAIYYQEYDLNKVDGYLEYYLAMVRVLEQRSQEGHAELRRLKEIIWIIKSALTFGIIS